ncbi:leucine rich repeat-containing protein [Cystoisospora suis]|uniref:Leucine-rich repeat-containing protein 51 n=1 Tax=Cystoisospora suis TaxID=483139 RepID=A0A2C6KQ88_9APIC|nr:leucine rich repeat-containing protein [Cystoisospora suis]
MQSSPAVNGRRNSRRNHYIAPAPPLDLSFRNYKSPVDILPEHVTGTAASPPKPRPPKSTSKTPLPPSASTPQQPPRPLFIIALANNNGVWPTAGIAEPLDNTNNRGDAQPRVAGCGADLSHGQGPGPAVASGSDSRAAWLSSDPDFQRQQQPSGNVPSSANYSFRASMCLSRHNSTVSLCTQPKNGVDSTVVDLHRPEKISVKLITTAVRLCNNQLSSLDDLIPSLTRIISQPEANLQWLDLAFNQLTKVDPALLQLFNLRVLYLHCNLIGSYEIVLSLNRLPKLKVLTLMGNPIESDDYHHYRTAVVAALPRLKALDHTPITGDDAAAAEKYCHEHNRKACGAE